MFPWFKVLLIVGWYCSAGPQVLLYTCRYTTSSPRSTSPGSGNSNFEVSRNPAAAIKSKKTSSLWCRIFMAMPITTPGDVSASRDSVFTSAGLNRCQKSQRDKEIGGKGVHNIPAVWVIRAVGSKHEVEFLRRRPQVTSQLDVPVELAECNCSTLCQLRLRDVALDNLLGLSQVSERDPRAWNSLSKRQADNATSGPQLEYLEAVFVATRDKGFGQGAVFVA